ncbi:MAG: carboxymuconolactone decarboxylase family protein [Pedobacter sp.]|uniref:carboxymuconolactone decarboxylase family protein n=1 Tax=Pedobacter sp. TaxID=1411316 RepID=UPI00339962A5
MEKRINLFAKGQSAIKPLFEIGMHLKKSTLGHNLLELVFFRASQINGCAYCLDMHSKELRAAGEEEYRLYGLSSWRETPYYTQKERAALAWAEALTTCKVTDEVYNAVAAEFSDEEVIDLTIAITTINSWNRLNLAFPNTPGTYKVGMFG